jgi:hypothetical protein
VHPAPENIRHCSHVCLRMANRFPGTACCRQPGSKLPTTSYSQAAQASPIPSSQMPQCCLEFWCSSGYVQGEKSFPAQSSAHTWDAAQCQPCQPCEPTHQHSPSMPPLGQTLLPGCPVLGSRHCKQASCTALNCTLVVHAKAVSGLQAATGLCRRAGRQHAPDGNHASLRQALKAAGSDVAFVHACPPSGPAAGRGRLR